MSHRLRVRATIAHFEAELRARSTEERAVGEKRYLKSDLDFLGATVPTMRQVVKRWSRAEGLPDHATLWRLVDALWRRRTHELRMVGIELLTIESEFLEAGDLKRIERLLRRADTWAYVDPLAAQVAGGLLLRFPERLSELDRWVADDNFWIRRSSLLALMGPLKEDRPVWRRFAGYADRLLDEREFFIRKAIGWVLREVGKRRPDRVERFVAPRIDRIAGLTLREAVRYLPTESRERLLAACRDR